jgi:hypothetical protein
VSEVRKTAHFKVFCLERYKHIHSLTGKEAIGLFKQYGVLDYLSSFYDVLHSFGDEYIVQDIDEFIEARKPA